MLRRGGLDSNSRSRRKNVVQKLQSGMNERQKPNDEDALHMKRISALSPYETKTYLMLLNTVNL